MKLKDGFTITKEPLSTIFYCGIYDGYLYTVKKNTRWLGFVDSYRAALSLIRFYKNEHTNSRNRKNKTNRRSPKR